MADKKDARKNDKAPPVDTDDDEADKAEGGEGLGDSASGAAGGGQKKLLLFIILPLILLIVAGGGAYYSGLLNKFTGADKAKPLSCDQVKEGDKDFAACAALATDQDASKPGVFIDIPPMIVNLSNSGKQQRFLKITMKVEVDNVFEQKKLDAVMPRIVDQFQMYLRELRLEDLRGTSGIYRMKIELLSRVRAAAPNIKIRDVLFQEILVQ